MTENTENIIKLDIPSFVDMCQKIETLENENQNLNEELTHFKARSFACMQRCKELTAKNREIELELKDLKFTNKCLTPESSLGDLPKKYIHHVKDTAILHEPMEVIETLADLGGFQVYEVIGYNDEHEGYTMDLITDEFILAERASVQAEEELVSALGSYLGDD